MTLKEAIKEEKNFAEKCYKSANFHHTNKSVHMEGVCIELAEYHEQVAKWLEELQELKKGIKEDCISRQEVEDTIWVECSGEKLDIDFAKVLLLQRAIKSLPPVTSTQKWIPCSEQLPKESGKYLVTFGGTHLVGIAYYTTEEDAKEIFEEPEEYVRWKSQNVIAWKSLSESYKGEMNNESQTKGKKSKKENKSS